MHKNEIHADDSHRYKDQLAKVERAANHTNMASGFGLGLIFAMIYTGSALILWYGSKLVRENDAYAPGDVFVVSVSDLSRAMIFLTVKGMLTSGGSMRGRQRQRWRP